MILGSRDHALTVRTGAKAGTKRVANSAYQIYPPRGELAFEMPLLAQHMLYQTWCAHPTVRTLYMVLNPWDWDVTPKELVQENLPVKLENKKKITVVKEDQGNPWD